MTRHYQWTLSCIDNFSNCIYIFFINCWIWYIATNKLAFLIIIIPFHKTILSILCKVKHYWTWTTCRCDIKCARYSPCYFIGSAYLVTPLCYWLSDTYNIGFLESITSQRFARHLTHYHNHWSAIHHCITDTSNCIGCAWTRSNYHHACLTTHACITLRSVCCTLFVAHQDML